MFFYKVIKMEEDVWTCAICGIRQKVEKYYVMNKEVFTHQTDYHAISVCFDCKRGLDRAIKLKEMELLRQHPEIYKEAFWEYKMRRR